MKPKRPKDMNQLAASIVAIASGDENIDNDLQQYLNEEAASENI